MRNRVVNTILALALIAMLILPLAQPAAAGRCKIVVSETLGENRQIIKRVEWLCCVIGGRQYCKELERWPDDNLP